MPAASPASSGPDRPAATPRQVDWLLTDIDWLVTGDQLLPPIASGALAIEGESLVGVGSTRELQTRFRGRQQMNLRGHLVLPGLINTHTHAAMTCLRGLGNDLPLQHWLHQVIFPAEGRHVNPDFVYWGTLWACVEMLQNGITTFCDGYFFEEAAVQAVLEAGARAVLGQGILDFPTPDQPQPDRSRERAEAFLERFPTGEGRVRPSLFCHAPYTCSAQTLHWVKELCRRHDLLFQLHLSETAAEVTELTATHGQRPVPYLDGIGVLDRKTLCAHAIWLDPAEIELLALRGVGITHNPESNMKLASGVAPVPDLLAAGVRVGLGTDGCASNNDLDLFGEMSTTARLHKAFRGDPLACPASQVVAMATCEGAKVLAWEDAIGRLQAGKKADLIAIDLNQPHLTPLYDPVSHLTYAAKGSDVRYVWVNGRLIVAGGVIQTVDTAVVAGQIRRIAERVAND